MYHLIQITAGWRAGPRRGGRWRPKLAVWLICLVFRLVNPDVLDARSDDVEERDAGAQLAPNMCAGSRSGVAACRPALFGKC